MAPLRFREAVPVVLLILGVAAGVLSIVANDIAWKAIWIGVSSTGFAAGLVDGSAQLEAHRREDAVLRVAAVRVEHTHVWILQIIECVFAIDIDRPTEVSSRLRRFDGPIADLAKPAQPAGPAPSPRDRVLGWCERIEDAVDIAVNLGAPTSEASRFSKLALAFQNNLFMEWLRMGAPPDLASGVHDGVYYAPAAADILEVLQREFRGHGVRLGYRGLSDSDDDWLVSRLREIKQRVGEN